MGLSLQAQTKKMKELADSLDLFLKLLEERKRLWMQLDNAERKKWASSDKDPVMKIAKQLYDRLGGFFCDS